MLAKQLGYYDKAGVNVNLIDEPAGGDATQNMLAGQVQGVGGFYDHNIALQARASPRSPSCRCCRSPARSSCAAATSRAPSSSPADFKGRSLGITDTGSSTDFLTQYLSDEERRRPRPDDPARRRRRSATFIAAMKQKAIDCGMTTEPTVSQALSDGTGVHPARHAHRRGLQGGARRHLPGHLAVHARPTGSTRTRTTVQKLVNAYVSTLKWIQQPHRRPDRRQDAAGLLQGRRQGRLRQGPRQREGHLQPDRHHAAGRPEDRASRSSPRSTRRSRARRIDLAKTYTDEFVKAATSVG